MSYNALGEAARSVREARSIAVLTGAGVSAESGIPTFRGAAGLWKQFRPEDLATPQAFARDPALVWEWYVWRRALIAQAEPNPAHRALGRLEDRVPQFTLVTQNVDGLHQRAGSRRVLEAHGSIWTVRCTVCGCEWPDDSIEISGPLRCTCGALARPGVVWFGEPLPIDVWAAAERAAQDCEVMIVVGTSALVYPAAGLPGLARKAGARLIEVNVEATSISSVADWSFLGRAGEILPHLAPA